MKGGGNMTNSYITISGDMWDSISYKIFGTESYTDRLIKSNLEYKDIVIFPAGVVLNVPETEIEKAVNLPPWKR